MRMRVSLIASALLCLGCGGDEVEPTSDRVVTQGEYTLLMDGEGVVAGGLVFQGALGVDTEWDRGQGLVYLGTDDNNEPICTLTMYVSEGAPGRYFATSAVFSKSDVRVGTADVINARTYRAVPGLREGDAQTVAVQLEKVEVGANFIKASIRGEFERVRVYPTDAPERIGFRGTFTAVKK